jgi:hypothetical protein
VTYPTEQRRLVALGERLRLARLRRRLSVLTAAERAGISCTTLHHDPHWIDASFGFTLAPGSSLGGAWEWTSNRLAEACGIWVPKSRRKSRLHRPG